MNKLKLSLLAISLSALSGCYELEHKQMREACKDRGGVYSGNAGGIKVKCRDGSSHEWGNVTLLKQDW